MPKEMSTRTAEERRWAAAIADGLFGVWDLDLRCDVVHYSPRWKTRLGFPRVDAADGTAFWRCRVHPADLAAMMDSMRSHLDGRSSIYESKFRLRSNGSGYRSLVSRGRVVERDRQGAALRMIGTMVDLTGRPIAASSYGLVREGPQRTARSLRSPFHELLGSTAESVDDQADSRGLRDDGTEALPGRRWVESAYDLLEVALGEASAPR